MDCCNFRFSPSESRIHRVRRFSTRNRCSCILNFGPIRGESGTGSYYLSFRHLRFSIFGFRVYTGDDEPLLPVVMMRYRGHPDFVLLNPLEIPARSLRQIGYLLAGRRNFMMNKKKEAPELIEGSARTANDLLFHRCFITSRAKHARTLNKNLQGAAIVFWCSRVWSSGE